MVEISEVILVGIVIFCFMTGFLIGMADLSGNQEETQEDTLPYSKDKLVEKKVDLDSRIRDLQFELFYLRKAVSIVEADLDAKEKNLSVEYLKLPDSEFVMRVEYNGSHIDSVEIKDLMKDTKVSRR